MIAHPERNREVMRDPSRIQAFIEQGCWLQVTAGSVTGQFGEQCQFIARQLLEQGAVKVLASDGHNARMRPPVLKLVFDHMVREYGEDMARGLFIDTPAAIAAAQFR